MLQVAHCYLYADYDYKDEEIEQLNKDSKGELIVVLKQNLS